MTRLTLWVVADARYICYECVEWVIACASFRANIGHPCFVMTEVGKTEYAKTRSSQLRTATELGSTKRLGGDFGRLLQAHQLGGSHLSGTGTNVI